MARGLVGKFLRGVNAIAAPAALAEQAAQIQAKRDAKVQSWQTGERAAGQAFTAGENAANREFQSGENAENRAFQTGERVAGQEFQAGENAATREQQNEQFQAENARGMAQFGLVAQQAQQALETGELGLVQARRVEGLRETLFDPEASDEIKLKAEQDLLTVMTAGAQSGRSFGDVVALGNGYARMANDALKMAEDTYDDSEKAQYKQEARRYQQLADQAFAGVAASRLPRTPGSAPGPAMAPPPDAVAELKQNDTPAMRAFFDAEFGPGSAARALGE